MFTPTRRRGSGCDWRGHGQAEAKLRSRREAALKELDTGADQWSADAGTPKSGPEAQLSVATETELASMAQAADPSQTQDPVSLKAKVEAGEKAWAKLQQLHEQPARARGRWVPPPGSPPMAEPPLIFDTPTAARQQEWETGKAPISRQFFDNEQVSRAAITAQTVSGPVMASVPGRSAQYFESEVGAASPVAAQAVSGPFMASVPGQPAQYFEREAVAGQSAPVAQVQTGPMMSSVDTSAPQFFETPSGQVVEMAQPQALHAQGAQQPRFFETPAGAVVEVEDGQMRQVGGVQLAAPPAQLKMNVVPNSESTKLSEDTDDLDGSTGVVHSEPLEDATMSPENQYTVEGTSFPTEATVMSPTTYLPVAPGQPAAMVGGLPTGYGDVTTPMMAQTQEMAAGMQPRADSSSGRTQSLYGLGGRDDPMEGVYKIEVCV